MRKLLYKLVSHHGEKGLVQMLKQVKAWALHIVGGNMNFSLPWFRTKRYKGYLYPKRFTVFFRPLVDALIREDYISIQRVLSALNVYQVIMGPIDDPNDVKAPVYAKPATVQTHRWDNLLTLVLKFTRLSLDVPEGTKIEPTGQSVAITPSETGSYTRYVASQTPETSIAQKWLIKLQQEEVSGWDHWPPLASLVVIPRWQGNLTIIGDRGGKSRLILVGTPYVQSRLRPLQKRLLSALRSLPTDCTFNQQRGLDFIVQCHRCSKEVFSVDLKDATWHFPFSLQQKVLETLGGKRFLPYFYLPVSDDGRMVYVRKGQAMGLGPSFPLFGLTHNLVLVAICKAIGKVPVDTFRVLGDDVIIADRHVRDLYLEFARDYSIPISWHKCLEGKAAEFAGKVIYKGHDITPIRWTELGGEQLPPLFHPYKKVLRDNVYKLITDQTAFLTLGGLPKMVGGLGLSRFDEHQPVTSRHLRLRLGQIRSRIDNLLGPPIRGESLSLKQEPITKTPIYAVSFPDEYLRDLAGLLEVPKVKTEWGDLPYLGHPGRTSAQLGVDIPLMPSMSRKKKKPHEILSIFYRRYYGRRTADNRRSELREAISGFCNEYFDKWSTKQFEDQKEKTTSQESPRSQEVEDYLAAFVPTLFYE
jgi:hypothetical protein